jgi:hypothetical protein
MLWKDMIRKDEPGRQMGKRGGWQSGSTAAVIQAVPGEEECLGRISRCWDAETG